jgi:benzylsuccinate CoA-transferase BbsF subunit
LQHRGVPAGVAGNAADVINDPQMKTRGFFREITHTEIGTFSHQNPSFKLSKTPCDLDTTGPIMGQHTEYVCREFLGISDEEFVALLSEGALE